VSIASIYSNTLKTSDDKNMMMKVLQAFLFALTLFASNVNGFAPASFSGGSSFVVTQQRPQRALAPPRSNSRSALFMGNQAKFGVFSPAVYVGKLVLGGEKLNKIRGKAISLHSQYIGDFCQWVGAYHLRTRLIKKAKVNGDTLGFLV
jgi:hypothetical protein